MQVCPSLLVKKDRGRPANPKAKPKAFGEVHVAGNIPDVELLEEEEDEDDDDDDASSDDIDEEKYHLSKDKGNQEDDDVDLIEEDGSGESDGDSEKEYGGSSDGQEIDDGEDSEESGEDDNRDDIDEASDSDEEEIEEDSDEEHEEPSSLETNNRKDADHDNNKSRTKKRKFSNFEGELDAADKSLRALKKLAGETGNASLNTEDGILSNEDFQRIKELKVWIFLMPNQTMYQPLISFLSWMSDVLKTHVSSYY